jgi:3-isopropylmalate/(R)-2-methylmalate dehydratase large subunit
MCYSILTLNEQILYTMTIVEKILAAHSGGKSVKPGEILDVTIDVRLARDFGGAGVVQNLQANNLEIADSGKTFFTFDCNPTGSDQLYAANQQKCRVFARAHNITVYDITSGIGTHLAIDEGLSEPGSTLVSTDSHANILGAIGAFGQGMGDRDIAAAWSRGSVWFKVPESAKITLVGERCSNVSAKDVVLNLLKEFGPDHFLGMSVELYGEEVEVMTLDERITISSMATEMGAIALIFPPSQEVINYCKSRSYEWISPVYADADAHYALIHKLDIGAFRPAIALPGQPYNITFVEDVQGRRIDSVFIGSCTNGRMDDMREAARLLKNRRIAPGIILKIVPATDEIWKNCLTEGLIGIFKSAGALFGNAGCAGCASGQIGQNGPGEKTISTGNRNFEGKQGKGEVYLASVSTAVASAITGCITQADQIPEHPIAYNFPKPLLSPTQEKHKHPEIILKKLDDREHKPSLILTGKIWLIPGDNIDTDMIYHNRHLAVTNIHEMGQYAFGNLKGWENYANMSEPGDIIITGSNFGAGSSRQQAVDCFKSLGNYAILARSFGAIYERNAINAGFPVITYGDLSSLELNNRDTVTLDLEKGIITHVKNRKTAAISKFSDVQRVIYEKGDLLKLV